jgi:hypothetical protein
MVIFKNGIFIIILLAGSSHYFSAAIIISKDSSFFSLRPINTCARTSTMNAYIQRSKNIENKKSKYNLDKKRSKK